MTDDWKPPTFVPRGRVIEESEQMLDAPDLSFDETEDVFRISEVGLDWNIGVMVYEPRDTKRIPLAVDGTKMGAFILHGGSQDFRSMEGFCRLITRKLGFKVVSMTYPGRLNLANSDRIWPGDTIRPDGSVRTPIWVAGEMIDRSQYDIVEDTSMRSRYGTRVLAKAKPGTTFHARMAGWPAAFELGMIEACSRHLGEGYSILSHGHSTGGPFASVLGQRIPNVAGIVAIENSPFGYVQEQARVFTGNAERRAAGLSEKSHSDWRRTDPFDELSIRTWREEARYLGPQAAASEGVAALMRLPELMEDVLALWDSSKIQAGFKCEYPVTRNITTALREAANATAERLALDDDQTTRLVDRYLALTRELTGPDELPVPPTLFGITEASRDHPEAVYHDVILPAYAAMTPPPRTALTRFGAGVHDYTRAEPELPYGVAPSVITGWRTALDNGFFN
ncbi:MAG: pimeloyl-ACP methyl ester carboxylesterase [Verrucomicrobiales bacterium]|jgi:pimeloyl-ACP methyl ester carboxylesterase